MESEATTEVTVRSVAGGSEPARSLVAAMLADLDGRYGQEALPSVDERLFAPPQGEFLVALCGAEAVGCGAFVRVEEGLAELKRTFVRAEWRRRGVGSVLLRGLEERAWASGYGAMRLEAGRRQEALALYRRHGYRVIPRFPPHCDDELSVCMAKELRPFAVELPAL
jgi:GNAT superfamily N-acetyltransferase